MFKPIPRLLAAAAMIFLLAGCASGSAQPTPLATVTRVLATLAVYRTPTHTYTPATPFPTITPTATLTPTATATPTPRTHTVKAGEDMFGIALRYRVKLDDLKAVNPTVDPRLMKIGTVLVIPPGAQPATQPTSLAASPTPTATPVTLVLEAPACLRDAQGGAWCFVLVRNRQPSPVENVTVKLRLEGISTKFSIQGVGTTLLDLLAAGAAQPAALYFTPPLPDQFKASAELVSALPASVGGSRYLANRINNQRADILPDGMAAEISGELELQGQKDAAHAWVAAIAYDSTGQVVGVRRWEAAQPLKAGSVTPFGLRIYSAGAKIERVEVVAETR